MHESLEPDRLRALRDTQLLDSPPETAFDRLTRVAAILMRAPVALVSLVDDTRQFFKSAHGLGEPWASKRETPLTHSFCAHTARQRSPLVVTDAREHPLVRENLAIRDLAVIAYVGVPLLVGGEAIGAFCVIDHVPRAWSAEDVALLRDLAASVVSEIELRATMRSMHEQRALTDALLEGMADGVLAIDTKGTFIMANSVGRRWFKGAELGKPLPPAWSPRQRSLLPNGSPMPQEEGALARGLRGEATDGLTFNVHVEDGPNGARPTWLEANARPVRDADGKVIAVVGVYRDVTDRAEHSEQKYRDLYETAPDMYMTTELPSERIVEINQTMCDALGYTKAELLGGPYHAVYPASYREVKAAAHAVVNNPSLEFVDVERMLRRKDGSLIDVSLTMRRIIDERGKLIGTKAVWHDITRRKQGGAVAPFCCSSVRRCARRPMLRRCSRQSRPSSESISARRAACSSMSISRTSVRSSTAATATEFPPTREHAAHALQSPAPLGVVTGRHHRVRGHEDRPTHRGGVREHLRTAGDALRHCCAADPRRRVGRHARRDVARAAKVDRARAHAGEAGR